MFDDFQDIEEYKKWIRSVIREQQGPLLRFAQRMLNNVAVAEEVVQDTLIKLLETDPIEIESYVVPWLFRICRNLCLDYLRSMSLHHYKEQVEMPQSSGPKSAEELYSEKNLQDFVLSLVKNLEPKIRELILLKFQNEFSYKDISKITGLTEDQIGYLIHQGVSEVKQKLEEVKPQEKAYAKKVG